MKFIQHYSRGDHGSFVKKGLTDSVKLTYAHSCVSILVNVAPHRLQTLLFLNCTRWQFVHFILVSPTTVAVASSTGRQIKAVFACGSVIGFGVG